ncbi:MerC family mercury resistance protein [Saccharospirillum salsuginis]|uniref:Arsenite methyltransferase n=1 Tax=Saccharospirillum salsuginis TaxID=418750 RepID=A0A918KK11_9GAMM|nr:MerC family mercury resistance protein [Saccharospirillum salsuginis]GGX66495.1 hypothetical protein GCM10007392_37740 [Saccharospirillum salsuginis]
MVAILGYTHDQIRTAVRQMYTAVAERPRTPFHFLVGRHAGEVLGYPDDLLDALPEPQLESFAGVGYPFRAQAVCAGDTCLDIGAGAGTDSLIAAGQVGARGRVIALDMTPAMAHKLRNGARRAGFDNVQVVQGSAEAIPLDDESVDVITSNGALNLVPDKRRAVAEMFRVLRPGGRLQIADVVIGRPVTVDCHSDPRLWVECVVGATPEDQFLALFRDAGFEDIDVLRRFDYFSHSPSAQTREIAAAFGACAIEVGMRRGVQPPAPGRQWLRRLNPRRWLSGLWRRGLAGWAGLGLALMACYGLIAVLGILVALGVSLMLNEAVWAGAIVAFTLVATAAVLAGTVRHRKPWPAVLAVAGAALVLHTQLIRYQGGIELVGFALLAAAVGWDFIQHRRWQARVLGLDRPERRLVR